MKRGLTEEQSASGSMPMATAAPDAFKLDASTPEPEDLDTMAPNSTTPSPLQPHSLALEGQNLPTSAGPGDNLEEELQSKLSQLVSGANSKDSSSSEDESVKRTVDKQGDKESERLREKTERGRQRPIDRLKDRTVSKEASETVEHMNGQHVESSERLTKSASVREEERVSVRRLGGLDGTAGEQEQSRGDNRETKRQSKRQQKRDAEKDAEQKGVARSGSSASSPALSPSYQEGVLSDNEVRASARQWRFIFTPCKGSVCLPACLLLEKAFFFLPFILSSFSSDI